VGIRVNLCDRDLVLCAGKRVGELFPDRGELLAVTAPRLETKSASMKQTHREGRCQTDSKELNQCRLTRLQHHVVEVLWRKIDDVTSSRHSDERKRKEGFKALHGRIIVSR